MKHFLTALAAALFAAIASISFSLQANAGSYIDYNTLKNSAYSSSLQHNVHHTRRYYNDDYDNYYEEEDDYYPRDHYERNRCYTEYVSEYVCKTPKPRCLKQRECVWYYGEEFCRYVRKCAHTEKKCKYVKVPRRKCW